MDILRKIGSWVHGCLVAFNWAVEDAKPLQVVAVFFISVVIIFAGVVGYAEYQNGGGLISDWVVEKVQEVREAIWGKQLVADPGFERGTKNSLWKLAGDAVILDRIWINGHWGLVFGFKDNVTSSSGSASQVIRVSDRAEGVVAISFSYQFVTLEGEKQTIAVELWSKDGSKKYLRKEIRRGPVIMTEEESIRWVCTGVVYPKDLEEGIEVRIIYTSSQKATDKPPFVILDDIQVFAK